MPWSVHNAYIMKTAHELIKDVKEKTTFAIMIAIFFTTFMYSVFRAGNMDDTQSNKSVLTWGIGIAFYILNYLLIEECEKDVNKKVISWIRGMTTVGIIVFILPIICIAGYYDKPLPIYLNWPLKVSMGAILFAPVIACFLILGGLAWAEIRGFFRVIHDKNKPRE